MDGFNKMFPEDGTPLDVVGNKTLNIIELSNTDVMITLLIVNQNPANSIAYQITKDEVIKLPENSTQVMFSVSNEPKDKATFNFQLLN